MSDESSQTRGVLGAAGSFVASVIGLVKNRLELFSLELKEEKLRLVQLIIWSAATVFAALMALVSASFAVVYAFWSTALLQALLGLTLFYLVVFGAVLWRLRRCFTGQPKPFASTLAEFEKDHSCIPPKS